MQKGREIEMNEVVEEGKGIGTEIFDKNLPSNIDFDQQQHLESEPQKQNSCKENFQPLNLSLDGIRSYKVIGKAMFNLESEYTNNLIITNQLPTFHVKAFDDEKSAGLKSIWETIVGYSHRYLHLNHGYVYVLERKKEGLLVHSYFKTMDIFKIFVDTEEQKIRFVLHQDNEKLITKNYQSQEINSLIAKLTQQLNSIGLSLVH